VVGRQQGMVSDGHPHPQQEGVGPNTVEIDRQMGIGHHRVRAHGMMDGWTKEQTSICDMDLSLSILQVYLPNSILTI